VRYYSLGSKSDHEMNIWIFCHYASVPSIGQYTGHYDLARGLVEKGHRVTVFASSFSHYTFRETLLRENQYSLEEDYSGVRFVWLRTPPYRANDWRRICNMLVYSLRAGVLAVLRKEQPDVCIGVCVHPFAAVAAWIVAKIKRSPFVYEIRDLWPLVLIETGRLVPHGLVATALYAIEGLLVRGADHIIGAWRYFDSYLARWGYPADKVTWIPQFADLSRLPPELPSEPEGGQFTVMYTGGHVHTMGIDVILRAASILQSRSVDNVRFVFVGSGQEKPSLVKLAEELRLRNAEFRDPLTKDKLYDLMAEANAFIISLRGLPHHQYGVCTNKICDYLAMRRPIIYATLSSYNPVREAGLGFSPPPESPEGIADAVIGLMAKSSAERRAMGERAYQYMLKYHERMCMVDRLEKVLGMVCVE